MDKYRHITDRRMMAVAEYVIAHGISDIATLKDWCDCIGIAANNMGNIRAGKQSFSHIHILNCLQKFNINANYIYGLSEQILRNEKKTAKENPVQTIKTALAEIEIALKKRK